MGGATRLELRRRSALSQYGLEVPCILTLHGPWMYYFYIVLHQNLSISNHALQDMDFFQHISNLVLTCNFTYFFSDVNLEHLWYYCDD